jgi:uncharacterized protein DUF6624
VRRPDIARELLTMASEDGTVRARLAAAGKLSAGYHQEMRAVHRRNGDRLAQITAELGAWPGFAAVGREGSGAAFVIAQHDIAAPALMRRNRMLLERAVADGDAESMGLAYMEDRIRAFEGRLQRYGTQLGWDDTGTFGIWPAVEDVGTVDERRAYVGLSPLQEHLSRAIQGMPESDRTRSAEELDRYRREADAFARAAGWRGICAGG